MTQYDPMPDKPRCDSCGKYISKAIQLAQCKGDGLDCIRIIQCTKCKIESKIRGF